MCRTLSVRSVTLQREVEVLGAVELGPEAPDLLRQASAGRRRGGRCTSASAAGPATSAAWRRRGSGRPPRTAPRRSRPCRCRAARAARRRPARGRPGSAGRRGRAGRRTRRSPSRGPRWSPSRSRRRPRRRRRRMRGSASALRPSTSRTRGSAEPSSTRQSSQSSKLWREDRADRLLEHLDRRVVDRGEDREPGSRSRSPRSSGRRLRRAIRGGEGRRAPESSSPSPSRRISSSSQSTTAPLPGRSAEKINLASSGISKRASKRSSAGRRRCPKRRREPFQRRVSSPVGPRLDDASAKCRAPAPARRDRRSCPAAAGDDRRRAARRPDASRPAARASPPAPPRSSPSAPPGGQPSSRSARSTARGIPPACQVRSAARRRSSARARAR